MNRKSLEKIQSLAGNRLDTAAIRYKESQVAEAGAEQKLAELRQYSLEYSRALLSPTKGSLPARQLADYHLFMGRLEIAISQQERSVEASRAAVVEARQHYLEMKKEYSAYEYLVDKRTREAEQQAEKRETAELEDIYMNRRSGS